MVSYFFNLFLFYILLIERFKTLIGRLDDNIILKFFKEKLLSKACQNQGFIIDGFPKTIDQAKTLFERKIFKKKKFQILLNLI